MPSVRPSTRLRATATAGSSTSPTKRDAASGNNGGSHGHLHSFRHEYNLRDHLGNLRVSFTDADQDGKPEITQEQHYEAYGLRLGGLTYMGGEEERYLYNGVERIGELGLGWYQAFYRGYNPTLGRWMQTDPKGEERYSFTPYNAMSGNPINRGDAEGRLDTDFLNRETGEVQHVEDGKNQVVLVNAIEYAEVTALNSPQKLVWTMRDSERYDAIIQGGNVLNWESDLGKITRVVYGEMYDIKATNNVDRQVVAETIVNRKESGLYGESYSDVLIPKQYNAMKEAIYKDGPYAYMSNLQRNQPYYYKANEGKIHGAFLNALSVSYKSMCHLGIEIAGGAVSYVSPPLTSSHFDGDGNLTNITSSISGLKGISGVWKRK